MIRDTSAQDRTLSASLVSRRKRIGWIAGAALALLIALPTLGRLSSDGIVARRGCVQRDSGILPAMLRTPIAFPAFLLLLATMPVRAQFAREDFAVTACGQAESLFRSGLETAEQAGVSASGGAGGDASGAISLEISVPDTGRTQTYLLHVPVGYHDQAAWPLVVALHGSPGSAAAAPAAAASMRVLWEPLSDREGLLVLAPIASGNQGGWVPSWDTPALACALATIERAWNVDRARRYLWGFSAGGHYGHGLALGNAGRFAAYAVNAGVLQAFACGLPGSLSDCATTLPQVARRIPISLRVGILDTRLRPSVIGDADRLEVAGWLPGVDLTYSEFYGGHTVGNADIDAAWGWFAPRPLLP